MISIINSFGNLGWEYFQETPNSLQFREVRILEQHNCLFLCFRLVLNRNGVRVHGTVVDEGRRIRKSPQLLHFEMPSLSLAKSQGAGDYGGDEDHQDGDGDGDLQHLGLPLIILQHQDDFATGALNGQIYVVSCLHSISFSWNGRVVCTSEKLEYVVLSKVSILFWASIVV